MPLPRIPPMSPARRRLLLAALAVLALLVAIDFFLDHHPYFGIDGTPGFAAWYGLGAALAAIVLALGWTRVVGRNGDRPND